MAGARTAIIYARISQDRAGAGLGVDRQREDCLALAATLGWTVVAVHEDNDVSAYSGKRRPGYAALLADLDAGRADAVLAWHTDRLHRSPRELEDYVDLCERRGIVTRTVKAGELDLSTPTGRAVARTVGAWARFESEHKADRVRRAHEQAAVEGRWRGGARPFGWRLDGAGGAVVDAVEAAVVRDATAAVLAGASLGGIVADLNARGIPTSTGGPWNTTSLRQVLTRPRNAGLSELRGEVVGRTGWPVLVPEEQWRAVVAVLSDPGRRRSVSNRARHLLSGIATCGVDGCGRVLRINSVATRSRSGPRYRTVYRCLTPGRGHVARDTEALDGYVARLVVARLGLPDAAGLFAAPSGGAGQPAAVEADAVRARLVEAADQYADGVITGAQLARITGRLRERLGVLEAEVAGRVRAGALAGFAGRDPQVVWDGLSVERRRAVVALLVRVRVLPVPSRNGGFDPRWVDVEWLP